MNCANIRILLPEYIAGSLDASSAGQMASHLESCPRCRETAESLNAVLSPGHLRGGGSPEVLPRPRTGPGFCPESMNASRRGSRR